MKKYFIVVLLNNDIASCLCNIYRAKNEEKLKKYLREEYGLDKNDKLEDFDIYEKKIIKI